MDIIKRFWPWSEIARLKSDVAGYEHALENTGNQVRNLSESAGELRLRVDRQSATLHEKNAEIDALKLARVADERTIEGLRAQIAKFDHDGDGKPGGSKKRGG